MLYWHSESHLAIRPFAIRFRSTHPLATTRQVSVFDIIGPIMVGPSSSHTAGAVRLGRIARTILGVQPDDALIELHGSFAQTGQGHGTHKAVVAGLLDMPADDDRIPHSFAVAAQMGLTFRFEVVDLGEDVHPNTARLTLSAGNRTARVTGASVGGGMVKITNIQGYEVDFGGEYDTLLVIAEDRKGTVNAVTGWLLARNINVAYLQVGRRKRGGQALMIVEVDDPIPAHFLEDLKDYSWVEWVRVVPKIEM